MHNTIIRSATVADGAVLYAMLCQLEQTQLPLPEFEAILEHNLTNPNVGYWIAEQDTKPVGVVSCHLQALLHHATWVAEIQEMYVAESHRSQGIGKALIQAVEAFAKANNVTWLEVTTRSTRIRAQQFNRREGFEATHAKLVKSI